MPVLELLNPQPGERILDLGCGDGELTRVLRDRGCDTVGIDPSAEFVAAARKLGLDVREQDARELDFEDEFDAVFSNAVLHWIAEADVVLGNVHCALRPGGRFVGEFGGYGNCAAIEQVLVDELKTARQSTLPRPVPGIFLQRASTGTDWPLQDSAYLTSSSSRARRCCRGECLVSLETFADSFTSLVAPDQREGFLLAVCDRLEPLLGTNGEWIADYVRLRFEAIKGRP